MAVIFCFYCDRVFSDESTLITHQKARHFKCDTCHKKLNSISGLSIHCNQVHKVLVERVPHAMPGRDMVDIEIFGMSGVPEGTRPGQAPPPPAEEPQPKQPRMDTVPGQGPPGYQGGYGMPGQ
eukprot:jgi/Astpho2/1840/Aster-x0083